MVGYYGTAHRDLDAVIVNGQASRLFIGWVKARLSFARPYGNGRRLIIDAGKKPKKVLGGELKLSSHRLDSTWATVAPDMSPSKPVSNRI